MSKRQLAVELRPVLEKKISDAAGDESIDLPPIAEQVYRAYLLARRKQPGNFALPDAPAEPGELLNRGTPS